MDRHDATDFQRCFGCGQQNPLGLHLVFRVEGEHIVADFQPREEHQSFPGVIHGGIIAAVFDETLGRIPMLTPQPQWMLTGRLEIRYRRYVPYGPLLRVSASLLGERRSAVRATGTLSLAGDQELIIAEAHGTFLPLTDSAVDAMMKDYPGVRGFFGG